MAREDATPPFRYELRHRRLAAAARRAIKRAGLRSVEEIKATPRAELMRVLPPTSYDYLNDALNRGDDGRLRDLTADDR